MTRKDLELIVLVINSSSLREADKRMIAVRFATQLMARIPKFNYDKFIDACLVVR